METVYIETERLRLRSWKDADKPVFAEMNGNRQVMRFFPDTLTEQESDNFVERIIAELKEYGVGLYAAELKETGKFIGYVGFHRFSFDAPFAPGWEIGWRISDKFQHRGLATEAAAACLAHARLKRLFSKVYSFTSVLNVPSENVMKRIGMSYAGTFMHPALPAGHPLREHKLYEMDLERPA